MKLGTVEVFEIWFLPHNRDAYCPRCVQEAATLDKAKAAKIGLLQVMHGELEIVRVRTERARVA